MNAMCGKGPGKSQGEGWHCWGWFPGTGALAVGAHTEMLYLARSVFTACTSCFSCFELRSSLMKLFSGYLDHFRSSAGVGAIISTTVSTSKVK